MSAAEQNPLLKWHVLVLAVTCGMLIANLYFVQPISHVVAETFSMPLQQVGLLTTLPLVGYGIGLLLAVPLGDLFENRRLILVMVIAETVCLFLLWWSPQPSLFLIISFAVGVAATAIQIILPYTSQFFSGAEQGRAVARLVTGVMLGILIARPFAGFIAEELPWRSVYLIAALLMTTMSATLIRLLPPRIPKAQDNYAELMRSMASILRRSAVLQSRTLYQAAMFGAFITFWTAIPLWLYGPPFNLSLGGIAWVAFAGAAGALSPPIATRLFDAGYGRTATVFAMVVVILAFLVTVVASTGSVALIVIAAILLDSAVSANLVIGQRALYELEAELRGRMNALFMGIFFLGGALASASAGWIFAHYGWTGIVVQGIALPACALMYNFGVDTSEQLDKEKKFYVQRLL